MKKINNAASFLIILIFSGASVFAQQQPGVRDGKFNAEQYKIDRMKSEAKPNTNIPVNGKKEETRSNGRLLKPGEKLTNYDDFVFTNERKLNYSKVVLTSEKKKIKTLEFEHTEINKLDVTHNKSGLEMYPSDLFHERELSTWSYNNFKYEISFSFDESAPGDFGVGYSFSTRPSDKHACDEYLFFAFIIMKDGRFLFQKSVLNRYKTYGTFNKLKKDAPHFFDTTNYTIAEYAKQKPAQNSIRLTIQQIKGDFQIHINSIPVYQSEDYGFDCPVYSGETPYNIFLNKGKVRFGTGKELYIDKQTYDLGN